MFVGNGGGDGGGGGGFMAAPKISPGIGLTMLAMSESDGIPIPWNSGGVPIGKEGPPTVGCPNGNGFGICI